MINKKISSSFALTIIFFITILVGFFLLEKIEKSKKEFAFSEIKTTTTLPKINRIKSNNVVANVLPCENKIFEGLSRIKVWQSNQDSLKKVKIKKEDLNNLPITNSDEIILVDYESIAKKLNGSSEKNPVEITITGFAQKCNETEGINFASINYKKGIFDFKPKN